MRIAYVLASYLLFWVLFPALCLSKKTRNGLKQRLGFYSAGALPEGGAPRVWLHGASAGDLLALSPMIRLLRSRFPRCRIIVSTTTNTGFMMASERLARVIDAIIYGPYDLWGATRRAVRAIQPDLLVLEYTEIWPNLIRACRRSGCLVALANGRFSPAHLHKYRLLFSLIENPLKDIDLFLMRDDEEAERVLGLEAPLERVWVTGNTKFDALTPAGAAAEDTDLAQGLGISDQSRVWIAGSTHDGEEELLLEVYKRLLQEHPDLRLVIAPRYVDRAQRILSLVQQGAISVRLRSQASSEQVQVVVLDTIGELSRAYRLATVVFVGGSFTSRGGQNILEPAAQGRPVLFGPNMDNFRDSVQVLVGRGGIQVKDPDQLYRVLSELLARPSTIASLGALAQATVRQISGASERNVEHLERLWSRRVPARVSLNAREAT
jgi:3-deoxy-D-manno-octulosonic-acid transferase